MCREATSIVATLAPTTVGVPWPAAVSEADIRVVAVMGPEVTRVRNKVSCDFMAVVMHVVQNTDPMHLEATLLEDGLTMVQGRRSSPQGQPRSKARSLCKDLQGGAAPSAMTSGPMAALSTSAAVVPVGIATRSRT